MDDPGAEVLASPPTVIAGDHRQRRRSSAFASVAAKEIVAHLRGVRFVLGLTATLLLCVIAAWIRIRDFRAADREQQLFVQRWLPSIREQLARDEVVEVENTRAMSPLSTLSIGLEPVIPFRFASTKEGLRFGQGRGSTNPLDVLLGYLDITFIVSTVLSLLALTFTFDSISGEKVQGTLSFLLSYPLSRPTLLAGKIAGNMTVVSLCFVPGFVAVAIITSASGTPMMQAWQWFAYGGLALFYLLLFVSIGVAVSATGNEPADSAVKAVFLWAVLVFIVPRVAALFMSASGAPGGSAEISLREEAAISRLRLRHHQQVAQAFEIYMSSAATREVRGREFQRARQAADDELRRGRHVALRHGWQELQAEEERRDRWTRVLTMLSPTAVFQQSVSELAFTGLEQRRHFLMAARTYDERIGRPLAESRERVMGNERGIILYSDIRPLLVPFRTTWAPTLGAFRSVRLATATLLVFLLIAIALGYHTLGRLDVRG